MFFPSPPQDPLAAKNLLASIHSILVIKWTEWESSIAQHDKIYSQSWALQRCSRLISKYLNGINKWLFFSFLIFMPHHLYISFRLRIQNQGRLHHMVFVGFQFLAMPRLNVHILFPTCKMHLPAEKSSRALLINHVLVCRYQIPFQFSLHKHRLLDAFVSFRQSATLDKCSANPLRSELFIRGTENSFQNFTCPWRPEDEQRASRHSARSKTEIRSSSFSPLYLLSRQIPPCMSRSFRTERNDRYLKWSKGVLTIHSTSMQFTHHSYQHLSQDGICTLLDA